MSQKKSINGSVGVCSANVGSHTAAIRAGRALATHKIQSEISRTTTASGCSYIVSFPCVYKSRAEEIMQEGGIRLIGYLG